MTVKPEIRVRAKAGENHEYGAPRMELMIKDAKKLEQTPR
jgi:hypothetical protein